MPPPAYSQGRNQYAPSPTSRRTLLALLLRTQERGQCARSATVGQWFIPSPSSPQPRISLGTDPEACLGSRPCPCSLHPALRFTCGLSSSQSGSSTQSHKLPLLGAQHRIRGPVTRGDKNTASLISTNTSISALNGLNALCESWTAPVSESA